MRLIQVRGAFYFNDDSLPSTDIVTPEAHRVPGGAFLGTLMQGSQEYFVAVILKIGLPFQLQEFKSCFKALERFLQDRKIEFSCDWNVPMLLEKVL